MAEPTTFPDAIPSDQTGDPPRAVTKGRAGVIATVTGFVVLLAIGWTFILWANKFRITAPVAFVCLGYLAAMATILNLWRTGAAVAAADDPADAWDRMIGPRGELEKAKRVLLKAIKEAQFDHAMGKLSQADADALIQMYRARAIELIKELDRLDAGAGETPRDQIRREVKARMAMIERRPAGKLSKEKEKVAEVGRDESDGASDGDSSPTAES